MSDLENKFTTPPQSEDPIPRAKLAHLEMRRGFWLVDVRKAVIKAMGGVEHWECPVGEKPKEAMWRMTGVEK